MRNFAVLMFANKPEDYVQYAYVELIIDLFGSKRKMESKYFKGPIWKQYYAVSVGRIGKLECDFILRDTEQNYSYVQVAYTINESKQTEDREYRPLEMIRDNFAKYVVTTDYLLQKRNGINHINILEFIKEGNKF